MTPSDLPVIEMVRPMLGFPDHTRYALVRLDDDGVLCALRSLDDPDLRFLVVPADRFFPEFAPVVPDETVEELAIVDGSEVAVLLVLTPGEDLAGTTANLLAPVLLNTTTRTAAQVVLDDPQLPLRSPLVA
jgi:flagellar assembly factor FliW